MEKGRDFAGQDMFHFLILNGTNQKNIYNRGYKKLYQESVLPATQGCDFDFLK